MTRHFKRGRPRVTRPHRDPGTPELVAKRLSCATTEPLDLCLAREFITPEQHWCGIHLRCLYTLRFGAPGIRAIDPTHFGGKENNISDPVWRAERESEYNDSMQHLRARRLDLLVLDICVHHEMPILLRKRLPQLAEGERQISLLRDGLTLLTTLWRRR